jgi:hypothetical protein
MISIKVSESLSLRIVAGVSVCDRGTSVKGEGPG